MEGRTRSPTRREAAETSTCGTRAGRYAWERNCLPRTTLGPTNTAPKPSAASSINSSLPELLNDLRGNLIFAAKKKRPNLEILKGKSPCTYSTSLKSATSRFATESLFLPCASIRARTALRQIGTWSTSAAARSGEHRWFSQKRARFHQKAGSARRIWEFGKTIT